MLWALVVMEAVAGEMSDDKAKDEEKREDAGDFYPSRGGRLGLCCHNGWHFLRQNCESGRVLS